ncbi:hypothetical protein BJF79_20870 [Actinomadura sp. CNU-125]|uniref:hypothetical protein n=1 Tax=Actinomadura sp. CNU-125 TaxID=1904961 RepID=UPI00095E71B6|nr:hypothetical protein [Actinomadura sp. CNU-125]OLT13323.1 hypothetical protein BJF79_20870 [Actinomadura sp. CNU-125]
MTSASPQPGLVDVVVIGAPGPVWPPVSYLRRAGLDFAILDAHDEPGGAWRHTRPSLRLFPPAQYSSLPGRPMPATDGYPDATHVVADLSADLDIKTSWATPRPPRLLLVHVDGRALFKIATRRRAAILSGADDDGGVADLGDIVAVPPVRAARERGDLHAHPMFDRLTTTGIARPDGTRLDCDPIIWAPASALRHLALLRLRDGDGTSA